MIITSIILQIIPKFDVSHACIEYTSGVYFTSEKFLTTSTSETMLPVTGSCVCLQSSFSLKYSDCSDVINLGEPHIFIYQRFINSIFLINSTHSSHSTTHQPENWSSSLHSENNKLKMNRQIFKALLDVQDFWVFFRSFINSVSGFFSASSCCLIVVNSSSNLTMTGR